MILVSGDAKLLGGPRLQLLTGASPRGPANPDCGRMTQQMRFWTSPKSVNPNPDGILLMFNTEQGYKLNTGRAGTADDTKWESKRYERFDIGTGGRR
jgi:hypothetical protein